MMEAQRIERLFISHSSADDAFVRQLQQQLEAHQVAGWIDSRQLLGGALLRPEISAAIEAATAFLVVPLLLDGTQLGAFTKRFAARPKHVPVSSTPGGVEASLDLILTALGLRLPADVPPPDPAVIRKSRITELSPLA